jgi:transcriptional regulator with XRE-family HTH domain
MAVTKPFGEKVRRLRQAAGMSQSELAIKLELSHRSKGYISELEHGKKEPPVDLVLRLARLFPVTIDELLRDEVELRVDREQEGQEDAG